ncbi:MAG: SGNH/GDSL hydrolase family protein [Proteobacteria bacterium]|nr:SGNH/GDSL hydrolase family protein [Pseudomonadota bacterium]
MSLSARSPLPMLLLALLALASLPAAALEQGPLVIFGDSLSDPGNYFIAFGQTSTAPFAPIPDAPYDIGPGHHFSNGRTWAERLAFDLDAPPSGMPALARPGEFTNYAVGRARARPAAATFSAYDLGTQVALYLGDVHGHARVGATYVIWIGANDLDDALGALSVDPTGAASAQILQEAIEAVAGNVQLLWSAGARTFLIPNLPDLSETPAVRALGPAAMGAAAQLSAAYNAGLAQGLAELAALPGIRLVPFDVDALLNQVIAQPGAFGLEDVTDACLAFFTTVDPVCAHPQRYLFWDGIHPTAAGHAILALAAQRALACDATPALRECR